MDTPYVHELLRDDDRLLELFDKDLKTALKIMDKALHRMEPIDANRMRAFIMQYKREYLPMIAKKPVLEKLAHKPLMPLESMWKPLAKPAKAASPKAAPPKASPKAAAAAASPKAKRALKKGECPEGTERNPKTKRCKRVCPKGKERNAATGNCNKKCPEGQVRNPRTGRCRKAKA